MTIGERIKKVRKNADLPQDKFAERIGVTKSSISLIENGRNNPSEQTLKLICQEFSVSYDWLVNGVEPMYLPKEEAANFKLERLMKGDNEFVKAIFREMAELPLETWEQIEAFVDRMIANKKNRPDKTSKAED